MKSQPHVQPRDTLPVAIVLDTLLPGDRMSLALLERGIRIQIPTISVPSGGQTLNVLVDGEVVLNDHVIPFPPEPLDVTVPLSPWLAGGKHEITYTHASDASLPAVFYLDRVAPYQGNVPPAPRLPEQVAAFGLSAQYLQSHGDQLSVTVPGYEDMEFGQHIHGVWAGHYMLQPVLVTEALIAAGEITLSVPGTVIRATGDGERSLHYHLSNSTGIVGHASLASTVDVQVLGSALGWPAPEFVDIRDDGWLWHEDVFAGARLHVPSVGQLHAGDEVTLVWQAYEHPSAAPDTQIPGTSFVSAPQVVDAAALSAGLDFVVPWATYIEPIEQLVPPMGAGKAAYQVRRGTELYTSALASAKLELTFAGGLGEAEFLGKNDAGWLIGNEGTQPYTEVKVPAAPRLVPGDLVSMTWIGNDGVDGSGTDIEGTLFSTEVEVNATHIAEGLVVQVPFDPYIYLIRLGSARVDYSVTRGSEVHPAPTARINVDVRWTKSE